ncbi:MAG: VOC family protein [Acidimicrobiales bacterium]|jgi:predicted enzyme related to lactoylglutathione lyase
MPDPFLSLRSDNAPVDPDPAFAARLRTRLEQALSTQSTTRETSTLMTTVSLPRRASAASPATDSPDPLAPGGVVPYLAVRGAQTAIEWYAAAFGARLVDDPILMPDGRIGHCTLELSRTLVYLSDESPASHVAGPVPGADATVTLVLNIADVDATVERALAEGATLERPAADYPYGRNAVIRDPFAHRWMVAGPTLTEKIRHGDTGYVSLWVPDEARARRFFAVVLGWPEDGHRHVPWRAVPHGFAGGVEHPTLFCNYGVDDLDSAVDRVRQAGGSVEEVSDEPWGRSAMCTDPEGMRFALYELSPAEGRQERPALNGERHGDVSYITMHVVDSAVARAFYGTVLGWEFEPGHSEDGWGPVGVAPMTGLAGGSDRPRVLPMYRVDDIQSAVARIRAEGGTATDPELMAYGWSSECEDDQGTAFYLGQH